MRSIPLAAGAAALLLAACDPTDKKDFHCTAEFKGEAACTQLHITETEALVAEKVCKGKDGDWGSHKCPGDLSGVVQVPGDCVIDGSDYSVSGTDPKVFFYYTPADPAAAQAACASGGGTWHE